VAARKPWCCASIPFEVVPGVTAAAGCSSYSGIPLTHRGLNHGVRFITGHQQNNEDLSIDWSKIADPDCTLVIYMVIASLADLAIEVARAELKSPVTTIVGKVVSLSDDLDWFGSGDQHDVGVSRYDSLNLARA